MTEWVRTPSGLVLPEDVAEQQWRAMQRPKAMDLFCGAGGFSLGVIQAGFEVVAAVEWDPICVMTYMSNLCRYGQVQMHFIEPKDKERMEKALAKTYEKQGLLFKNGEIVASKKLSTKRVSMAGNGWISHEPADTPGVSHIFIGDARKLTGKFVLETLGMKRGELDLIVGGPPCQGYSISGKRDVADPRNNLIFEYARLVCEIMPKTMCMEEVPNVLNMTTPDGRDVIGTLCSILERGDFAAADGIARLIKAQTGRVALHRRNKIKPKKRSKPKKKPVQLELGSNKQKRRK